MIFIQNFLQESAYDVTIEDLFNATVKLEEKEKVYSNAEGEVIKYLEHKNILNCIPAPILSSCPFCYFDYPKLKGYRNAYMKIYK